MSSTTITAVISVYNGEATLKQALTSVSWADEIIVIDASSTDSSKKIAGSFTKKVFSRPNFPMLNTNKNFGFEKATGDWILSLDADESIPKELSQLMRQKTMTDTIDGYWIPRKNIIFGRWIRHGLWWPDKQLRLFRRGKGAFPCVHIHEYIDVDGKTAELDIPFDHLNYTSISQYLRKMDTLYTENEVENRIAAGYTVRWSDALRFPASDFLKVYFAQEAYKDGLHGLVLSILQAFYSFIVFAKLWEREAFSHHELPARGVEKELTSIWKDIKYWLNTQKVLSSKVLPVKFWYRLMRRFR